MRKTTRVFRSSLVPVPLCPRLLLNSRQGIGERCFDEGMYEAARLLFKNIHNNAKLALCLVHLGQYREAVEAATKANAVNTWKQVNTEILPL